MHYDIEFYKEDGKFCAYIGQEDGRGRKIKGSSIDALSKAIGDFFANDVEEKDFEVEQ